MKISVSKISLVCAAGAIALSAWAQSAKQYPTGYSDTPLIPGQKYRVHDDSRPRPRVVTPGEFSTEAAPGKPPSDAIVLFDGSDLSEWQSWKGPLGFDFIGGKGEIGPPQWKVEDGAMVVVKGAPSLMSKRKFGDVQLHVEWASPQEVVAASQGRGNSGVLLMGAYEIQVLDSYDNKTYADGQAAAIYGQYPPLVNASRPPGHWQVYDIVFEAPRFQYGKLIKPAYATVFHNGVLMHHRREILGPMRHKLATEYEPQPAEGPLVLQMHTNPVRYRNIWVRPLDLTENER
ncbi:MAG: DUF1080 domain-containing protein [Acidobacteria bacterium]|nr:DUF1080 domain-containing protein [Acidobacteriota bacterium]